MLCILSAVDPAKCEVPSPISDKIPYFSLSLKSSTFFKTKETFFLSSKIADFRSSLNFSSSNSFPSLVILNSKTLFPSVETTSPFGDSFTSAANSLAKSLKADLSKIIFTLFSFSFFSKPIKFKIFSESKVHFFSSKLITKSSEIISSIIS